MKCSWHCVFALSGVLAVVVPPSAQAGGLPRVFLSPAERAEITANRLSGRLRSPAEAPSAPPAVQGQQPAGSTMPSSAATLPRATRIEGVTFGTGTRQAVWIGGVRIADGGSWSGHRVQVLRDGVRLIAADGRVRVLRVGVEVRP